MGLRWKSLMSKIHPPLPLSPRESQRLLSLLNTSFKQQLDRYHPANLEQDAGLHLRSILSNPLFQAKFSNGDGFVTDGRRKKEQVLGVLQNLARMPTEIFQGQVSAGTATMDVAKLCLRTEHKNCFASPTTRLGDAMSTSGMGSLVLEWLWASGLEDSKAFLTDWEFVRQIVPFLVAEKQQDRIWRWLHGRQSSSHLASLSRPNAYATKDRSNLLLQLVSADHTYGQGLESAVNRYIRSIDYSHRAGLRLHQVHSAAGWYLTLALSNTPKVAQMEWSTVQRFMKAVMSFSRTRSLIVAYHWMYFAKDPSPEEALTYFQELSPDYRFPKSKSHHVVLLGLKAAEIFIENGREAEALWLMDYLRTNFRDEIGAHSISRRSSLVEEDRQVEEEKTLRSLDTLAIQ